MQSNLEQVSQSLLPNLDNIQNALEAQIDETKEDIIERIDNFYEVHDIYNVLYNFVTEAVYKDYIPQLINKAQQLIEVYQNIGI